jgi:hypothetical protein
MMTETRAQTMKVDGKEIVGEKIKNLYWVLVLKDFEFML